MFGMSGTGHMGEQLLFVVEGSFELGNCHSKPRLCSHYLPEIPKSNNIWNDNFPEGTVYETTLWNAENNLINLEWTVLLDQNDLHIPIANTCELEY
jgi:hypothetical protein